MNSYDLAIRLALTFVWLLLQRPSRRICQWPHLVAADLDDVLHVSCSYIVRILLPVSPRKSGGLTPLEGTIS